MFDILVVENPNDQWTLDELARSVGAGVCVQMYTKPAYALAWLEDNRPGLILASYRMPDMGCEEYIWLCRQIPKGWSSSQRLSDATRPARRSGAAQGAEEPLWQWTLL